jgi:hypothetical protein
VTRRTGRGDQDARSASDRQKGGRGTPRSSSLTVPLLLTLLAWFGIGLIVLGGTEARRSRWIMASGYALVTVMWLCVVYDRGKRAGEDDASGKVGLAQRASSTTAFPAASWLGVGLVPVAFVSLAVFDDTLSASSLNGVSALAVIALAAYVSRPLVTDQGRRELLRGGEGERRIWWLFPFSEYIASRAVVSSDSTIIEDDLRRRRYAMAIESLLAVIACVLFGFVLLFSYLAMHDYAVHLSGGPARSGEVARASSAYVVWHALDLVPLLDIPHTLNWRLERTFTDHVSGAILLVMKLFILGPILGTAGLLLRSRREPSAVPPE